LSNWRSEVPTTGVVELPPHPRALDALGRNHSLETAVADLVDNSIDAAATNVLIRFVQQGPQLLGLYVVDDGRGITGDQIDTAMTVGGRRDYTSTDLGRFGLGLKAASFSQASSLTVLSRAAGQTAVGRRWLLRDDRKGFQCDTVRPDFATDELDRQWTFPVNDHGTVVRWDDVHAFPHSVDSDHTAEFLNRTIAGLQGHLGLMFHRILASGTVQISIDVEDLDDGSGLTNQVTPIDPFGYPFAPSGWPKTLVANFAGQSFELHCHIWPRRSNLQQFRLPGGAEERQGLYFYRRDRLLQAGGWEGIYAAGRKLQLARVALDISGDVAGLFTMNAEKSRVSVGPAFARSVGAARASDGTTMNDYLRAAEDIWTTSNQRTAARKPVVPPGKGLPAQVSRGIRDELPQLHDDPLDIVWRPFTNDAFFEIDRAAHELRLNQRYRHALLGGRRGGLNDLPLLKAALYLLMEQVYQGAHLGSRDRDNIELWQEILTVAAQVEKSVFKARQ
jgi:hypothetical protein